MKQTLKFKINLGPPTGPADTDPSCREHAPGHLPKDKLQHPGRYRSRFGCAECKRRRVKCDETFPVCLRCQRRGSVCASTPRLRQWQVESPSIFRPPRASKAGPGGGLSDKADGVLLRYWLEKASQIMVIDPDVNPLSFPILEYVEQCPSLVHVMQSVGAAHKNFFDPSKLAKPLEERNLAIKLLQNELAAPSKNIFPVFISILLLGLSSDWIEGSESEFGQQHLCGARALVDLTLSDSALRREEPAVFNFILGAYIYWDMSCAHLIPSHQQVPIDKPEMVLAVLDLGPQYHPIGGYCTEIFYTLSNVLRYFRLVVDTGIRNPELEKSLRHLLLEWKPRSGSPAHDILCEAFRAHGLINLALCSATQSTTEEVDLDTTFPASDAFITPDDDPTDLNSFKELASQEGLGLAYNDVRDNDVSYGELGISAGDEYMIMRELELAESDSNHDIWDLNYLDAVAASSREITDDARHEEFSWPDFDILPLDPGASIREQAVQTVRSLTAIPSSHAYVNLQPIPLLTAASELTAEDQDERDHAIRRFKELYSLNRIRANLTCVRLLHHLWEARDAGEKVTWLEFMLRTGWYIILG